MTDSERRREEERGELRQHVVTWAWSPMLMHRIHPSDSPNAHVLVESWTTINDMKNQVKRAISLPDWDLAGVQQQWNVATRGRIHLL